MLQSMESQEVRHALVTEQQQLCFQTKSNNGNLWHWVKKKTCFHGIQVLKSASVTYQITHGDLVQEETSVLLLSSCLSLLFMQSFPMCVELL